MRQVIEQNGAIARAAKVVRFVAITLVIAHSIGGARMAAAQVVGLLGAEPGEQLSLAVMGGAEYGFVVGVGAAWRLRHGEGSALVFADVAAPWAAFDVRDYRGRVGMVVPVVVTDRWRLAGRGTAIARGISNDLARLTGVAADVGLLGGWYGSRWYVAAEAGYDWSVATYVSHSALYRATNYADARSGWYRGVGGNGYAGAIVGRVLGSVGVELRVGHARDARGNAQLLPFYATVGVVWRG